MGERICVYGVWMGNPKGMRTLGRPRRRWENIIKIDLQEVGSGGMNWIIWLRIGTIGGHL